MNIQTITEPQETAKAKLKAYRAQLHRRADAEYQAIAQGYEALAKGLRLLDLGAVMRDVECDEKGRPKLAIARGRRRLSDRAQGAGAPTGRLERTAGVCGLRRRWLHAAGDHAGLRESGGRRRCVRTSSRKSKSTRSRAALRSRRICLPGGRPTGRRNICVAT